MNTQDFKLSPEQNEKIYQEQIRPKLFDGLSAYKTQTVLYLGGQPGSGKTTLQRELFERADLKGTTVLINADSLRDFHPKYAELLQHPQEYKRAPAIVNEDAQTWLQKAMKEAVQHKFNIVLDSTMGGNPYAYVDKMKEKQAEGYQIELHTLAIREDISRMGCHLRYQSQVEKNGYGRMVDKAVHDVNYQNLPKNLELILKEIEFKQASIYVRGLFKDEQGNIQNNRVEKVFTTESKEGISLLINNLQKERNKPYNDLEKEYYHRAYDRVVALEQVNKKNQNSSLNQDISNLLPVLDIKKANQNELSI